MPDTYSPTGYPPQMGRRTGGAPSRAYELHEARGPAEYVHTATAESLRTQPPPPRNPRGHVVQRVPPEYAAHSLSDAKRLNISLTAQLCSLLNHMPRLTPASAPAFWDQWRSLIRYMVRGGICL